MSNLFYDPGEPAKGKKVALCTTAYDTPSPGYVFSIQRTRQALEEVGIQTAYILLSGNCHVDDARNNVVQHFLLTDCTDLVFLDADVVWSPKDIIKLCECEEDLVGGIYPYRRTGITDKLPVLVVPGIEPEGNLLQVAGLPTGFMKIKRHVLETLSEDADHYFNKSETRSKVPILFERTFEDGARWGGDITFCRKWHKKGGKMYALLDLHLGHTGQVIIYDSLGAALRRQNESSIPYMSERVKHGDFNPELFVETRKALGNHWGALEDVLMLCALMGQKSEGPIIETGSGLTSIVLAASSKEPVYCLEHDEYWASKTQELADQAGVSLNIKLCGIKDGWYVLPKDLPREFSLGLNDGPPRLIGSRIGFFDHFGNTQTIIVDDADDPGYGGWLKDWSSTHNRRIDFIERSALIRSQDDLPSPS